jgi:hydrogenase nickel incorporation protein HypA/HybF
MVSFKASTFMGIVTMHEWALAESVVTAAIQVAEKEGLESITKIIVRLGELQQINEEIFHFAIKGITENYKDWFQDIEIEIETERTKLECNRCQHSWKFSQMKKALDEDESEAIHFIPEVAFVHTRCPHCKSPDFKIIEGRGVTLSQIKGKKGEKD